MKNSFENTECYKEDDTCDIVYEEVNQIPSLTTFQRKFGDFLRLYKNSHLDNLNNADDSYIKSWSGSLEISAIHVSRQYFNSKLDCNVDKSIIHDNVEMSVVKRDNSIKSLNRMYSSVKVGVLPTHSRYNVFLNYDKVSSQVFPMMYPRYIEETDSVIIEYVGVNSKVIAFDNDMSIYMVDIDADRKQEITLQYNDYNLKDIMFISKGGTIKLDNLKDLHYEIKRGIPISFIAINKVTGQKYSLDSSEEIDDLFIDDYISKFGVLIKEDIERVERNNNNEGIKTDSDKYGWFVTSSSIGIEEKGWDKLVHARYCFNFYSVCSRILEESNIKLSENEWQLIRKQIFTKDESKIDLYAKLDNGHRIVALHSDFGENKFGGSNPTYSKRWLYNICESDVTKDYLYHYIDTDFSITKERFEKARKEMLDLLIKNKEVFLYDNEQDMNNHLYRAESDIELVDKKSILRLGFYSKAWNKYVVMYVDIGEAFFNRVYKYFALLEFSYPLNISENAMRNKFNTDEVRDTLFDIASDNMNVQSASIILNDILIAGGFNNAFELVILDEIKLDTKIVALCHEETGLRVVDINKILPLLKIVASDKISTNLGDIGFCKEIACKIGRYTEFNLYMIRVMESQNKYKYTVIKLGDRFHNYTDFFGNNQVIDLTSLNIV